MDHIQSNTEKTKLWRVDVQTDYIPMYRVAAQIKSKWNQMSIALYLSRLYQILNQPTDFKEHKICQ